MPAGIDHFIHGYGQGALVGANHPRQFAAGLEAFVAEPATGAEGAPWCAADGLIKASQAARRDREEFFQGHVGGGDWHIRRDVPLQHHDRFAGGVFFEGHEWLNAGSGCNAPGLRNGCGDGLAGQCETPIPGNDCTHQRQSGKTEDDTAVHDGSPFPAARRLVLFQRENFAIRQL
ncbi:hypothetical protein D3C84_765760 [compost metagenome]